MTRALSWLLVCFSLAAAQAAEKKLKVLTTFLPGYSFAANVAGDHAEVENLLPGGVSLHDFQLTPAEIRKVAGADLVFINGLGMETFIERVVANASGAKDKIVTLSDGLKGQLIEEEHNHHHNEPGHDHGQDPHIWLDPHLAKHCVTNVMNALCRADPANAAQYEKNARAYLERLDQLDAKVRAALAPVKDVPFITYHNAFRYFARRYGLQIAGVVEEVPEVSPSPREMSNLHRAIRGKKARALFTEPGGENRLARQVARDAKIKLGELDPLETGDLSASAYEEGMLRNARTLAATLQ
jgi:zinc/manganese transport system substrate-binding protein